jgi:hypothetical protein
MAKKKKTRRNVRKEKTPELTPYKIVLRDKFALAAIEGLVSARGMEVVNPTHMVKNAWHFADLMMDFRDWVEKPDDELDEIIETSPSDQPEGGG